MFLKQYDIYEFWNAKNDRNNEFMWIMNRSSWIGRIGSEVENISTFSTMISGENIFVILSKYFLFWQYT